MIRTASCQFLSIKLLRYLYLGHNVAMDTNSDHLALGLRTTGSDVMRELETRLRAVSSASSASLRSDLERWLDASIRTKLTALARNNDALAAPTLQALLNNLLERLDGLTSTILFSSNEQAFREISAALEVCVRETEASLRNSLNGAIRDSQPMSALEADLAQRLSQELGLVSVELRRLAEDLAWQSAVVRRARNLLNQRKKCVTAVIRAVRGLGEGDLLLNQPVPDSTALAAWAVSAFAIWERDPANSRFSSNYKFEWFQFVEAVWADVRFDEELRRVLSKRKSFEARWGELVSSMRRLGTETATSPTRSTHVQRRTQSPNLKSGSMALVSTAPRVQISGNVTTLAFEVPQEKQDDLASLPVLLAVALRTQSKVDDAEVEIALTPRPTLVVRIRGAFEAENLKTIQVAVQRLFS